MKLRPLVTLLLLFAAALTSTPATAISAKDTLRIDVPEKSRQQGQFFTVKVADTSSKPELWFMERNYAMFRQPDSSWKALVPVENLARPGSYALLIRTDRLEQKIPVFVKPNYRKVQHIRLSPSKQAIKATSIEKTRIKDALQTESPEKRYKGVFLRPSPGRISSMFGLKRSYDGGPVTSYHKGIDISAPQGTPVKSTAEGRVILTGTVAEGYVLHGNTVVIDHGQGLTAIYMHLHSITVKEGQNVDKGEIIGTVGHTGISTAPHLHWGTYLYGTSVDPLLFLGHAY
ncbi:MAG: M23 family metallopeptidase [Chlorobium sp.]|uniref:M23 family metallopeptidase n=1 Tax=Chlorobium sp. TaxID=1095 RepID=UPI001DC85581|nr:M23 family metallopeptidase [Chlorobium sp.]MBN1279239.1 M23 family metallopeptidase [Chlorobiaceae bacterium]MCF8215538.1 M23 family metallopeptidase [Chlorobium sp.]MCF8270408.1 M23 family metallopeptidase [Chlorobium sp.]MCF8286778.1 M23 family metallopeptidase [Chlorobium sp.]MCF8290300.1 M23 family metallopeptidase [Chlorobium sp.]